MVDGRVFVQGENLLMAYDAYNGVQLWQRPMLGAFRTNVSRDASNLAANRQGLFVAIDDQCLRIDLATGRTVKKYALPPGADGKPARWGYVACTEKLLYGSRSVAVGPLVQQPWSAVTTSDCVLAVDIESGKQAWAYQGRQIPHNSIAIDEGRLFLVDAALTPEERREATSAPRRDGVAV